MITSKEQIINYFKSGIKEKKDFRIGIEHEKFLFDNKNYKRINYSKIKQMFSALLEFGWNPILENENIIGLNKGGKSITLEPGNQIELSGAPLNSLHLNCSESYEFLNPQVSEEVFESCDRYVYSEHLRRGHNPQVKYKN